MITLSSKLWYVSSHCRLLHILFSPAQWKLLIGQLLQLNNSVEGCLIEKESLYSNEVAETSSKHLPVQVFQAVHSNMTGTCAGKKCLLAA